MTPKSILERVLSVTHNREDAEDAIQEAYLHQLTHKVKRRHFVAKALYEGRSIRRARRKFKSEVLGRVESGLDKIVAKDECLRLFLLLPRDTVTRLNALLVSNGCPKQASDEYDKPVKYFKSALKTANKVMLNHKDLKCLS